MTLMTPGAIAGATIDLDNIEDPGTSNATYENRARTIVAARGETFVPRPPPRSHERRSPISRGVTYKFLNFAFGDVADDSAYAQLREHQITIGVKNHRWHVLGAEFKIAARAEHYPKRNEGIKIYYILKRRPTIGPVDITVIPTGMNWYLSKDYTAGQAAVPFPLIQAITRLPFDTGVAAGAANDPAAAFRFIQWNLAGKIGWVTP